MTKTSKEYWAERAVQLESRAHDKGEAFAEELKNEYSKAAREIRQKIEAFYGRYASEQKVSYAEAVKKLDSREAREWRKTLGEYVREINALPDGPEKDKLTAELDARSYASRQDRLSQLEAQVEMEIDRLFSTGERKMTAAMTDVLEDGYYRKGFDLQKRVGVISSFARLSTGMIEDAMTYPWSGANFSDRIWQNKRTLLFNVQQTIVQGFIQGQSVAAMSNNLSDAMGKSYIAAERLIRTETNHFHAAADMRAYEAAGVKTYEFMAVHDHRTGEICASLDGKTFPVSEAEPGINYPPMHPNCRSTTVEYDPEDAADWAASGEPMPESMTYEEWKREQDEKYGEGYVDTQRKKEYNYSKDQEQYERYKETLGKNAPASFDAFQDLKYSSTGEWEQFKTYSRSIKSGELSALADFDLYKKTSAEIDEKVVGLVTSQGTKITGKANHFINRVIGSLEERRSGVTVENVIDALQSNDVRQGVGESLRYFGENTIVSVNPTTGMLVQANPRHRKKGM